jgi:hypothetical protein
MQEDIQNENEEVRTEPIIGNFKPKRKFLNFVSAVNGSRIRFIRDVAFIKGDKLSGVLEGVIFKVTICDEGTINFEEQKGSNLSDESMIKRLITDIDDKDVTGYAQKFVVAGLEFNDINGDRCYLEVEHDKPINKLKSLFEDDDNVEVSEKSLSLLDDLFGSDDEVEEEWDEDHALSEVMNGMLDDLSEEDVKTIVEEVENPSEPNEKLKTAAESYMEEQFRKMNEAKIIELEYRIEETKKEIIRYKNEAKQAESKSEEKSEALGVLETRLESMKPGEEPNGYVFFVSEEMKDMEELDEIEAKVANKIADIMKLKKDVLVKMLTEGYYKIKIAKSGDITNQDFELEKEVYQKIATLDIEGKMKLTEEGFEYRGKLNWHQLVSKMIKSGFAQDEEFDKLCNSNSYESKEEDKSTEMNLGNGVVVKSDEGFVDMSNGVFGIPPTNTSTLTEIKSKNLKTYNEETTLVVVGSLNHNENSDVEVTDDYTSFGVYVGDKKVKGSGWTLNNKYDYLYESDGFISIMTLTEFKKWQDKYPYAMEDGGAIDSFLLPNFKGTIGVTAETDNGFTNDFDLSDFIQHQDDLEDSQVYLTFPEGTQIVKMDDYHQVPVAAMRDIKIDKLIENKENKDMNKVLTSDQLEAVKSIKNQYEIDITKNWFLFSTQSDEFAESEDFKFWVTIQLEEGDDQDPICEDFLPSNIKNNLHSYAEVVFGYDGDMSEEEFIKELDKSPFFKNIN